MKTAEELKPCPFCGGEPEIVQDGRNGLKIRCKSCLIGIKQKTLRYGLDWLREKMIEGWNQRQAQEGWIRCKDRLPELKEHERVLVWDEISGMQIFPINIAIKLGNFKEELFWCPLPSPPTSNTKK